MSKIVDKVLFGTRRVVYRDQFLGRAIWAEPHDTIFPDGVGEICFRDMGWSRPDSVFPIPDVPEYTAFCYGDMPAYVFADWLEENIADIPAGLLQLLRESDA